MLKKILKELFGSDSDKRNRFRFDVKYVENLYILIDSQKLKLKEISLEGFSFVDEHNHFTTSQSLSVQLVFKERKETIKVQIKNKNDKICGCLITSNKETYSKMMVDELAPYLISFSN